MKCTCRLFRAPSANHGFFVHRTAPAGFIGSVEYCPILVVLKTHCARELTFRAAAVDDEFRVCKCETLSANATTTMTLYERFIARPLTMTEIAEDIRRLYIVLVSAGLAHGISVAGWCID